MKKITVIACGLVLGMASTSVAQSTSTTTERSTTTGTTTGSTSANRSGSTLGTASETGTDYSTTGAPETTGAATRTTTDTTTATTSSAPTMYGAQDNSSTTQYTSDSTSASRGGMFFEPMISVLREDTDISGVGARDNSGANTEGYGVGLRFGGHLSEIVFLGIDGRYANMETESNSFNAGARSDVYNVAPVIGIQTPVFGVRLTGAYVVAGENNPGVGAEGANFKFSEANGWRVGAGVHAGPVGISVEYQDLAYNRTDIQSAGSLAANAGDVDAGTQGYSLNLSFPVEL